MHLIIYGVISALIVIGDFISKKIVSSNMEIGEEIKLIENVFHITYVENTGASFGMLEGARWFFVAITVIFLAAIIIVTIKNKEKNKLYLTAVAFIVGGGIGNLIDRIAKGAVVDFFNFELINFAIFNVADCFVVVGIIMMCLFILITEIKERKMVEIKEQENKKSGAENGNS